MSKPSNMRRLFMLGGTQLIAESGTILRGIIVARLMDLDTLGAYMIVLLSMRLAEMATDFAVERYLVRIPTAGQQQALASAHGLTQLRFLALAALSAVAGLLGIGGLSAAAGTALAVGCAMRAATHLGCRAIQRRGDFAPACKVDCLSAITGIAAVWMSAVGGYGLEGLCWAFAAQYFAGFIASHILSPRPYRASFAGTGILTLVQAGWPLWLSAGLMFFTMQGERLILANHVSTETFAVLAVFIQCGLVPVLVASRIGLAFSLPRLARIHNRPTQFAAKLRALDHVMIAAALAFGSAFTALGPSVIAALFGPAFSVSTITVTLIAAMQALRLARMPHAIAAQARGQNSIPLGANILRLAGTAGALITVALGGNIDQLLAAACAAEVATLVAQRLHFAARNPYITAHVKRPASTPVAAPKEYAP